MAQLILATPYGELDYRIAHRPRVTRRLHLELDEDGRLVVIAPLAWNRRQVHRVLQQNTPRVERFLHRARQQQLSPLIWADGGQHLFQGERLTLKVFEERRRGSRIERHDDHLFLTTPNTSRASVRNRLLAWYRAQAWLLFRERMDAMIGHARWAQGRELDLQLRRMKSTWGTCSRKGVIRLNTHLVKAPLQSVDYVIAHELCHLEEMNHGPGFYALQDRLFPDWKQQRIHLREQGHRYTQE